MGKYAERKLIQWQEENAKKIIEQQRRKEHYDNTLETTRVTLANIITNLKKVLERELNYDVLIHAIKDQPTRKLELWEELKIVGFSRTICSVVCTAFAASASHVMVMVLAANALDNNNRRQCDEGATMQVQTHYLDCLRDLIEEQMSLLVSRIVRIITKHVKALPLTSQLTLSQVESLLQQVVLEITNDKCSSKGHQVIDISSTSTAATVLPWSQYLNEPRAVTENPAGNDILRKMHLMTVDIMNTDDFFDVTNTLIQVGLDYVLDVLTEHYYNIRPPEATPKIKQGLECEEVDSGPKTSLKTGDENSQNCLNTSTIGGTTNCSSNGTHLDTNNAFPANPPNPQTFNTLPHPFNVNEVSLVVAKLVPFLSAVLHKTLVSNVTQSNGYLNRLLMCTQLESMTYNVYDALVLSVA